MIQQLSSELKHEAGIELDTLPDGNEHAIEVELPFLQKRYGKISVLPIMMADQSWPVVAALAEAIEAVVPKVGCLLIDEEMLSRITSLEPTQVLQAQDQHIAYACGVGAIATVMASARAFGAKVAKILDYSTSAEITGDTSSVVGYGSVAFLRP